MSQFIDPITGVFDIQGYDSAMEGYEEELESWGNFSDDVYFFNDYDDEQDL